MRSKLFLLTALLVGLLMIGSPVASAATAIPVSGSGSGSTFNGTFSITKFISQNGQLAATGTLTGTLTNAAGVAQSVLQTVTIPVTSGTASCEVLHLVLGPLNLSILGLNIQLSQITLDITASPSGGLLGQLLCNLAGLNVTNVTNSILAMLNQILSLL